MTVPLLLQLANINMRRNYSLLTTGSFTLPVIAYFLSHFLSFATLSKTDKAEKHHFNGFSRFKTPNFATRV